MFGVQKTSQLFKYRQNQSSNRCLFGMTCSYYQRSTSVLCPFVVSMVVYCHIRVGLLLFYLTVWAMRRPLYANKQHGGLRFLYAYMSGRRRGSHRQMECIITRIVDKCLTNNQLFMRVPIANYKCARYL